MRNRYDILIQAGQNITRAQLAQRLGLSKTAIGMMLCHQRNITDGTLIRIARAFPALRQEVNTTLFEAHHDDAA